MKMSTRGRYGVRSIVDLAQLGEKKQETLGNIAKRQGVSLSYLEQTFSILKKSGLIFSIKGAHGGYKLASNPAQISVEKVLHILEGDLSIVEQNPDKEMTPFELCIKHEVWDKIDEKIKSLLASISIGELADKNKVVNIEQYNQKYKNKKRRNSYEKESKVRNTTITCRSKRGPNNKSKGSSNLSNNILCI